MDEQQLLPLSRDERLIALQCVAPDDVGIKQRQWRNVFELLRQIELCGGRSKNSFARVKVLAERMQIDERTVQRAAAAAIKAGLLVRTMRPGNTGQRSNEWAIQWDRIAILARPTMAARKLSPPPGELSPPGDQLSPPPGQLSPRIENLQIPLRESTNKVDRSPVDLGCVDWDKAIGMAREVERLLGPATEANWNTLLKAAVLSSAYSEHWFYSAASGAEQCADRNRWGFWWACLDDGAKKQSRRFRRDLARINVPTHAMRARLAPRERDVGAIA